jgi:hypothetical protein
LEQQNENEEILINDVINEEVVQPQPIELRCSTRERRPTQIDDYVYFNEQEIDSNIGDPISYTKVIQSEDSEH